MENLTAADVAAVTRPNYMGYGMGCGMGYGMGGDWILGLIVLAALFNGGGFGGFGGGGGYQQGFNTQSILSKLDGITNGLSDGFYATATNALQAQNQLQRDLCTGFAAVNAAITDSRFAAEKCCCETQRAIEGVNYNNAKNTCDIVNAIHSEGDATRALINKNLMDSMREQIQDQKFQISQLAQNAHLINALNPTPKPAYVVANPNCCQSPCGCGYNYGAFA